MSGVTACYPVEHISYIHQLSCTNLVRLTVNNWTSRWRFTALLSGRGRMNAHKTAKTKYFVLWLSDSIWNHFLFQQQKVILFLNTRRWTLFYSGLTLSSTYNHDWTVLLPLFGWIIKLPAKIGLFTIIQRRETGQNIFLLRDIYCILKICIWQLQCCCLCFAV